MQMQFFRTLGAIVILIGVIVFGGCEKDQDFITDGSVELAFSLDTLRFDTVFTSLGSATRSFKVYNSNDRPIKIGKIRLGNGGDSSFRLNVDGLPGEEVEDVTVWGNDSIYVFVEVTVDPDEPVSVSPFVIEEQVFFETNGVQQMVNLEAWGQNANYFPSRFNKGVPVAITCGNGIFDWNDPKPYVIYGEIFIDSCTLNIPAGARIYVHGGIARNEVFGVFNDGIIYTLDEGRINIKGTAENPVVIQGDRLEEPFQEVSGQWTGIVIGDGSKGNVIEYAEIKNSIFGVYVDSAAELSIKNSQIYNTAGNGIIGYHSSIDGENVLCYNNESNSVQLVFGGNYQFDHCTFASYGVDASALGMSNFVCFDDILTCNELVINQLSARFRNTIIFGSRRDEIELSDVTGKEGFGNNDFLINFENCIVGVDELLTQQDGLFESFLSEECDPCLDATLQDLLFAAPNEDDYQLDSLSVAIDQGQVISSITTDLLGGQRDGKPDIGCFERQQ